MTSSISYWFNIKSYEFFSHSVKSYGSGLFSFFSPDLSISGSFDELMSLSGWLLIKRHLCHILSRNSRSFVLSGGCLTIEWGLRTFDGEPCSGGTVGWVSLFELVVEFFSVCPSVPCFLSDTFFDWLTDPIGDFWLIKLDCLRDVLRDWENGPFLLPV